MGVLRAFFSVVAMVALIMSMAAAQYQTPTLPSHIPGSSHSAPDGGYYLGVGRRLQSIRDGRPPYKTPTLPGHSPESGQGSPTPATPTPLLGYGGGGSGDNGADSAYYLLGVELGVRRQLLSVRDGSPPYKTPTLPGHSPEIGHGSRTPATPTPLLDNSGVARGDNGADGGYYLLGVEQSEGRQLQSVRDGRPPYKKPTRPGHSPGSGHGSPTPATPTPLLDYGGGGSGDNGADGGYYLLGVELGVRRQLLSVRDGRPPYKTPTLRGHSPEIGHGSPTPATPTPLLDNSGVARCDNGADGGYYLLGVEQSEGRQLQSVRDGRPPYKKPTRPGHSPGSGHGPPNPPAQTPLLDNSSVASGDNGGAGGGDDDAVKDGGMDDDMKS